MGKFIDLTEHKFGILTVIKRGKNIKDKLTWDCKCDCGNYVTVRGDTLTRRETKNCGCLKKEKEEK